MGAAAAAASAGGDGYDLFVWGKGQNGALGLGNTTDYCSPVQLGSSEWASADCQGDKHWMTAIKSDGTLWSWGDGNFGVLGQGNTTDYSSPVQIGSSTTWSSVNAMESTQCATNEAGELWSVGQNTGGEMGDGTNTAKSSLVQIGSLTDWPTTVFDRGGSKSMMMIKPDGTWWDWGNNGSGRLGDGTTTVRSSPVQIGSLTTWVQGAQGIDNAGAIKNDGTLWTCGNNYYGALGNGASGGGQNKSSPIQVAGTTWRQVDGSNQFMAAVRTDNTLWTWGLGQWGKTGHGNTTNYSSPVQVGSLTDWKSISLSTVSALAIKTDGTLWSWGRDRFGSLGQGTYHVNKSSPVQIGSETDWLGARISYYRAIAWRGTAE